MEDLQESYRIGDTGFHNKIMRPLYDNVHYAPNDYAVDQVRGSNDLVM
jgi:hypothetical protein